MSDQQDPYIHRRPARTVSRWPLWEALRGLAIGVASVAAAVAVASAIIELSPVDSSPCDSEIACLPDLGPFIAAVASMPLVIAIVGPLAARLLGASRPGLFAVPAAWAVLLVCAGWGRLGNSWPFDDRLSLMVIVLIPYSLIALWTAPQRTKDQEGNTPTSLPESDS